jgi:hypothetical protein
MDANKVDMFFVANKKYFPMAKLPLLRDKLAIQDDARYAVIASVELKDPTVMLLISIFLGGLGIDRFMMKDIGMGILKLLTGGLCGILWIIDIVKISDRVKEENYSEIMMVM